MRIFKDYETGDNAPDSSDEDDDEYFNGQDENVDCNPDHWDAEDEEDESDSLSDSESDGDGPSKGRIRVLLSMLNILRLRKWQATENSVKSFMHC